MKDTGGESNNRQRRPSNNIVSLRKEKGKEVLGKKSVRSQ